MPEDFTSSNVAETAPAETDDERAGWDLLADLLTGFLPEQIPALTAARELEMVFPLLHALTRGSLRDFLVRVAVLEGVVADARTPLQPADIAEVLYWLKEPARDQALRTLRASGWLTFDPGAGYRVTAVGQFVATTLSFLRARAREGSLLPTVEGIDYMLRLGVDPVRQVVLLRAQLEELRAEMEAARRSHSEVILRNAVGRLGQALALSERIRAVLAKVPLELTEARRVAQDIHDLLSRLHGVGSDLHAAITEVGRQYLHLVAGLTTADIIATLMRLPPGELAGVGRAALLPVLRPVPLVVPELLAAAAEAHLARHREAPPPVDWSSPPDAETLDHEAALPAEVATLLDDLDRLASAHRSEPLHAFLPRNSAPESFLRASLLSIVGERIGGDGVAGRLGALPLEARVDEGLPECAPAPLSRVSPGAVGPPAEAEGADG